MGIVKVYRPQYYDEFSCTGSECADDCCHGWTVHVDKETYEKYKQLDSDFSRGVLEKIVVKSENPFDASITMNSEKKCPFFDGDGLCAIQKELDHDYLSTTCRKYPRIHNVVGGDIEVFLSMSCREAAKKALLNPRFMNFDSGTFEDDKHSYISSTVKPEKYLKADNSLDIFWKMRYISVLIIQTRKYKLWLRMVILGLFIKQAESLIKEENENGIFALSDEFESRIERGFYNDFEKEFPFDESRRYAIIHNILDALGKTSSVQLVDSIRKGLGMSDESNSRNALIRDYNDAYTKFYKKHFGKREYILENYIVNHILQNGFPCNYKPINDKYELMHNYIDLAVKFGVIKYALVGLCGYHMRHFNDDILINCIGSFSRIFDHSQSFTNELFNFLGRANTITVGAVSVVFRD